MANGEKSIALLKAEFPDAVLSTGSFRDQYWAEIDSGALVEVCAWLRDDPSMAFDFLADVTAVHWPDDEKPMELVYHLYSYGSDERVRLKVRAADGQSVPSLCDLWRSANWNEREVWDMFGIRFDGHPDLRRILMPDDYTDHPLRKEFPLFRG